MTILFVYVLYNKLSLSALLWHCHPCI